MNFAQCPLKNTTLFIAYSKLGYEIVRVKRVSAADNYTLQALL